MRAGGWRCGGPGRATGDTASVYTSAGDWMEGVSSAGGVKSISSSKWSSNSCVDEKQEDTGKIGKVTAKEEETLQQGPIK